VILGAYWATRFLAKRRSFFPGGRRIQVLERVPMARDASLALVRADGRTYLMSVGPGRVEMICDMDAPTPGVGTGRDHFESLISEYIKKEKPSAANAEGNGEVRP
jgi:flagellar biogenesis protein FliO